MIATGDSSNTLAPGCYFAILSQSGRDSVDHDGRLNGCQPVLEGDACNSEINPEVLNAGHLREQSPNTGIER